MRTPSSGLDVRTRCPRAKFFLIETLFLAFCYCACAVLSPVLHFIPLSSFLQSTSSTCQLVARGDVWIESLSVVRFELLCWWTSCKTVVSMPTCQAGAWIERFSRLRNTTFLFESWKDRRVSDFEAFDAVFLKSVARNMKPKTLACTYSKSASALILTVKRKNLLHDLRFGTTNK